MVSRKVERMSDWTGPTGGVYSALISHDGWILRYIRQYLFRVCILFQGHHQDEMNDSVQVFFYRW